MHGLGRFGDVLVDFWPPLTSCTASKHPPPGIAPPRLSTPPSPPQKVWGKHHTTTHTYIKKHGSVQIPTLSALESDLQLYAHRPTCKIDAAEARFTSFLSTGIALARDAPGHLARFSMVSIYIVLHQRIGYGPARQMPYRGPHLAYEPCHRVGATSAWASGVSRARRYARPGP